MPFEYCKKNYFTQLNQDIVKDVEEIMITDNDVAEENKYHKHGGLRINSVTGHDKIAIQKVVIDELYDVIPEKWLHITEDDTEDKKSKFFSSIYYTFIV
uniref:Transposase n=1 Tax=Strongyloides venezuelensis TaxID=75913 RepID=A0A0K0FPD9_STRVS